MFKSFFGRNDENDGVEIGKFEEYEKEDEEEYVSGKIFSEFI